MKTKKTILLFYLLFCIKAGFSQSNIQRGAYDINDPRNPDCPCHKMQKQAEEEYHKQQNSYDNNVGEGIDIQRTQANLPSFSLPALNVKPGIHLKKNRKSKTFRRMNDLRFRYSQKMKGRKRGRTEVALCYKW